VGVCVWARGADVPRNWPRRGTPRQPYCFVLLDLCLGRASSCQDEHAVTLVQRCTSRLGVRRYIGCGGTESARASVQTESKVAAVEEESKQLGIGALPRHRVGAAIGEGTALLGGRLLSGVHAVGPTGAPVCSSEQSVLEGCGSLLIFLHACPASAAAE
jgi:hypothetical protein